MMFKSDNNLTFDTNESQTGKTVFRLAMLICLFYVLMPNFTGKHREAPLAEHGIGGGVLFAEEISAEEANIIDGDSLDTMETSVLEPTSLSKAKTLLYDNYNVLPGDNISTLAINLGLNQDTIISINKISNSRSLQANKVIKIPNQDGILHAVKKEDTLAALAERYKVDEQAIKTANELFSSELRSGTALFIPGAKLDEMTLQEINGDLFIWPVRGAITSPYGYRRNPFDSSRRQFHSGIDIRGSTGTPVRAAMSGRVSRVGYDAVFGNYVVINHHSGYRTLYAHMSVIRTRNGAYVGAGERIGDVGSTGWSTGPHLHFTVYKNGVTVNPRALMK
jgi:murein DD-endopeptidase MepM/ murein hydrolase activator NlpD